MKQKSRRLKAHPQPQRFDSDRDALPFPSGGVFGASATTDAAPHVHTSSHATDRLINHVERTLDAMQDQLNTLAQHAGVLYRMPNPGTDTPRPAA